MGEGRKACGCLAFEEGGTRDADDHEARRRRERDEDTEELTYLIAYGLAVHALTPIFPNAPKHADERAAEIAALALARLKKRRSERR